MDRCNNRIDRLLPLDILLLHFFKARGGILDRLKKAARPLIEFFYLFTVLCGLFLEGICQFPDVPIRSLYVLVEQSLCSRSQLVDLFGDSNSIPQGICI